LEVYRTRRAEARDFYAADPSLETVADERGAKPQRGDCKVQPAGRWWFVIGGFAAAEHMDVHATIARAISPTTTLSGALTAIDAAYTHAIRDSFMHASAGTFSHLGWAAGQPVMNIFVGGVDRGVLVVGAFLVDLKTTQPITLTVGSAECPGRLCPEQNAQKE
jgi:hypothetical protein